MRQSGSLKQHTTRVLKRGSLALSILAAAFLPQWRRAGVSVANAASSYPETQFIGLEVLYNTTGGEQWTSSTGWRNPTLGVCSWYGITCDVYGENVTGLSLAGNRLDGNLSQAGEFFEMVSLQKVDLSNNRLVGPVPSGFGVMPNLQVLDLSGNGHASFPADWGSEAVSLQHLFLQRNSISGWVEYENTQSHCLYETESYMRLLTFKTSHHRESITIKGTLLSSRYTSPSVVSTQATWLAWRFSCQCGLSLSNRTL